MTEEIKNKIEEVIKEVKKDNNRERCLNCKHTKRFHSEKGCSQPTCMCNCFIPSGVNYMWDNLRAFNEGKYKAQKDLKKRVEELKYYQRRMLKERITDLFGFVEKHYMDDFLYEVVDREIDKIFKDVLEKQGERE